MIDPQVPMVVGILVLAVLTAGLLDDYADVLEPLEHAETDDDTGEHA